MSQLFFIVVIGLVISGIFMASWIKGQQQSVNYLYITNSVFHPSFVQKSIDNEKRD
ncbi:hypothetical protein [Fictibacillus terranigra]|uniref:Tumor necrosis factor receptor superfamily member 19 n=1 Tax=Fictibacillus terranigra TaxID=3058424 RepID=A0ABT8ED88_9BACL|nr:hypothetical protein [Fictibacillus sp. CENA-BCM004]MDN4075900.1 hypothetical protein [Fictibacillus sp. CENA-BCM004]